MTDQDQDSGFVPDHVEVAETHISVVFFIGDRAYKLKKPVRFDFVDLTSRSERERICHREVELNRRLAPDVYLGVLDVLADDGQPVDHLVEMRRMPPGRRLSTLVEEGRDVTACLRQVAHQVATLHAGAETSEEISRAGDWEAVKANWDDNLREMTFPWIEGLAEVERLSSRYLEGRRPLFASRVETGRIRDGHGDLLAGDIFCLDDGPRILDCIEYRDDFRHGDVIADVAFLVMDLERLERTDLAGRFAAWYRELSGEVAPDSLLHHYVAYRALIRSKVASLRAGQGDSRAQEEARLLLEICVRRLEQSRVRLVLVGGLPGTGKTTLSSGLSESTGWQVLTSDLIRKDLAGVGHNEPAADDYARGIYSPEHTERTYETMLERARRLLENGESVILDASWTSESHRRRARDAAGAAHADVVELECVLPAELAADRLRKRSGDASDADERVAEAMRASADPWPSSEEISNDKDLPAVLEQAVSLVGKF